MKNFIIMFFGPTLEDMSDEEKQAHMQDWGKWFKGLGDALVNPGNPFGDDGVVVDSDGSSKAGTVNDNTPHGFAILKAKDADAVVKLVQDCPALGNNNQIEIRELFEVPF